MYAPGFWFYSLAPFRNGVYRAEVLETGHVVMDGTGAELLTNERVRSAYLGG